MRTKLRARAAGVSVALAAFTACAREAQPLVVVTTQPSAFSCMTWFDGRRTSNACFHAEAQCMQKRSHAAHASSCTPQDVASCTEFRNNDNAVVEDCFSNAEQCAQFRTGFADPNESTPCETR
jgi:hypothetical protein